jgi:hypothetical protein
MYMAPGRGAARGHFCISISISKRFVNFISNFNVQIWNLDVQSFHVQQHALVSEEILAVMWKHMKFIIVAILASFWSRGESADHVDNAM